MTPEQMRALADRADEAGPYEVMETSIVDELATNSKRSPSGVRAGSAVDVRTQLLGAS